MSTVFYDNKNNVSSQRTQLNSNTYKTSYPGHPGRGGMTMTGKHTIERYDNNGSMMCRGIRNGRRITYFDKDHRVMNGISQF